MDRKWIVYYANYDGIDVEYVTGFDISEAINAASNRSIQVQSIICIKQQVVVESIII
jgi:hypothetical protein